MSKDPYILDDSHPGCFYKKFYGIVPISNSKRFMVIGPDKNGNCVQLKICNSVRTAKSYIDKLK